MKSRSIPGRVQLDLELNRKPSPNAEELFLCSATFAGGRLKDTK